MKFRVIVFILVSGLLLVSCAGGPRLFAPEAKEILPEFNRIVLETMMEYPMDGTHDYWWPRAGEGSYDGCTGDLYLGGEKVMKGEPKKRTYCCGLTLEIFLRSYKKWLEQHGGEKKSSIPLKKWGRFQKLWFVQELNGPGPSAALEEFHLGRTIDPDQALPGDFIQIWRTVKKGRKSPSGHSVIFLNWVRDESGKIKGFRYWSSQPGTDGIGTRVEHIGPNGGINMEYTYFGRVLPKGAKKEKVVKPEKKKDQEEKAKKEKPGKKKSTPGEKKNGKKKES